MKEKERKKAAKEFAERWKGRGYEKGESQMFWIDLLEHVFGVENINEFISFEDQVHIDHTSFIDGYIHSTHVMIEQKSIDKDLRKPIRQSDGSMITPFQQAKRYSAELPYDDRPRWIITCNFGEFLVYDMNKPNGEPEQIFLKDLERDYYMLQILVNKEDDNIKRETEISLKAGDLVGALYDAILKQYKNPDNPETLKSLNKLCVRLVFCLYAEDAGIFEKHQMFGKYLQKFPVSEVREKIIKLFEVLNTPDDKRDVYMNEDLAAFPYVNGGLFADENIEIPQFTEEIVNLLIHNASEGFNWADISPTIFGAVFESTLNPETRRAKGMHYTSIENIHKVIDPLFLDDLKAEFEKIKERKYEKIKKLEEFRNKLASLTFLDPACGSGNFLTETYICLRRLENEALKIIYGDGMMRLDNPIKVSISQFYGIEINDFAVTVARTALWISEAQMFAETEAIAELGISFLPLKSYANIVEGNALRIDWETVVPKDKLNYIMGNPPFVGGMLMSKSQKQDMLDVLGNIKGVGELDYVSAWYKKAIDYIKCTDIDVAFVSTNSICQGQQVVTLWKSLINEGIKIDFAYKTFIWNSESTQKAHVHCIIVGFSVTEKRAKAIYDNGTYKNVKNINPYLADAPNVFIDARSYPICDVPHMRFGSMPRDGGGFILTPEEKEQLIIKEPLSQKWIRRYIGATEFLNNKERYCLWLVDANPNEIRKCPTVMQRIDSIRAFRIKSKAEGTRKFALTPTLFCQIAQPNTNYILVPKTSSGARRYIPIGFLEKNIIASDAVFLIPNGNLYNFGILTSNVHNAWMRTVCGRLKSDYRYSKDIVYNNFPWCNPTPEQKTRIEQTAQAILDARAKFPDCSLQSYTTKPKCRPNFARRIKPMTKQ